MTFKCRNLPKIELSNAFKTNKKEPKKIWVPKDKIILVAYIFNRKKTCHHGTQIVATLLMTHDKRNVYVPMPDSHAWFLWTQCFLQLERVCRKELLWHLGDPYEQNVTCRLSIKENHLVWHKKLGHASLRLISKLQKHDLVRGLPSLLYKDDLLCEACQKGK